MAANNIVSIYSGLSEIKDLSKYTLMRGVTDFANLSAYNLYESGYSFLVVVQIPRFLELLKDESTEYKELIDTYTHILEYDFRGLEGLENMTSAVGELTNGISSVEIINKVEMQSNATFTMQYFERYGSVITRTHELFLRGLKDPRTQRKHYNGLIDAGKIKAYDVGYQNEVFSFMYIVTDNTLMNVEKAVYIVAAQPTAAELNIYNSTKGDIQFKELSVEFRGYPIFGRAVNKKAVELLTYIRENTVWDEMEYNYSWNNYGAPSASSNHVEDMRPVQNVLSKANDGTEVTF